ncbi:uncharacterized protein LOC119696757 [Motacilla alba alba]|uniref:uncharacterized protein LOC119696757 n=1 Tax=Motacilla alba alba TaxID=1094192 RepID=UPI0018D543A8|nr:uncharacterized protein LOC119696757 [Motacilla alba alba]
MGLSTSRIVEIQVINKTQNITLKKRRTYFYSGQRLKVPHSPVSPGSSSTSKFINSSTFWGCNGILAYEAESFTLAIYFSNPITHSLFSVEMGLELSLEKFHKMELDTAYDRLVRCSRDPSDNAMFPCAFLKDSQNQAQVSAGPVTVTATMARGWTTFIRVVVEERGNSGDGAGIETRPVEQETSGRSENLQDLQEVCVDSPGTARVA